MNIAMDHALQFASTGDAHIEEAIHIPVVIIDERGHSCTDPTNCRLNTNLNPYWCMTVNDKSWRNESDE